MSKWLYMGKQDNKVGSAKEATALLSTQYQCVAFCLSLPSLSLLFLSPADPFPSLALPGLPAIKPLYPHELQGGREEPK